MKMSPRYVPPSRFAGQEELLGDQRVGNKQPVRSEIIFSRRGEACLATTKYLSHRPDRSSSKGGERSETDCIKTTFGAK
ncbi:hypothetical protein JXQ31_11365 [candidate division KSB1 bacterium]|nr:hypothetical protein [candidate division KSB1 bacterium]